MQLILNIRAETMCGQLTELLDKMKCNLQFCSLFDWCVIVSNVYTIGPSNPPWMAFQKEKTKSSTNASSFLQCSYYSSPNVRSRESSEERLLNFVDDSLPIHNFKEEPPERCDCLSASPSNLPSQQCFPVSNNVSCGQSLIESRLNDEILKDDSVHIIKKEEDFNLLSVSQQEDNPLWHRDFEVPRDIFEDDSEYASMLQVKQEVTLDVVDQQEQFRGDSFNEANHEDNENEEEREPSMSITNDKCIPPRLSASNPLSMEIQNDKAGRESDSESFFSCCTGDRHQMMDVEENRGEEIEREEKEDSEDTEDKEEEEREDTVGWEEMQTERDDGEGLEEGKDAVGGIEDGVRGESMIDEERKEKEEETSAGEQDDRKEEEKAEEMMEKLLNENYDEENRHSLIWVEESNKDEREEIESKETEERIDNGMEREWMDEEDDSIDDYGLSGEEEEDDYESCDEDTEEVKERKRRLSISNGLYKCRLCPERGGRFNMKKKRTLGHTLLHLPTHTDVQPPIWRCQHCKFGTNFVLSMKKHQKTVHGNGIGVLGKDYCELWHPDCIRVLHSTAIQAFPFMVKRIGKGLEQKARRSSH